MCLCLVYYTTITITKTKVLEQWFQYNDFFTKVFIQWFIYRGLYTMIYIQRYLNNDLSTMILIQRFAYNDSHTTICIQWFIYNDLYTMISIQRFLYNDILCPDTTILARCQRFGRVVWKWWSLSKTPKNRCNLVRWMTNHWQESISCQWFFPYTTIFSVASNDFPRWDARTFLLRDVAGLWDAVPRWRDSLSLSHSAPLLSLIRNSSSVE